MQGTTQFLHGLTIDKLCGKMPILSMEGAMKALKEAGKKITWVQNAKVPEFAGGHVDILVDIKYNCLLPKLVFSLECRLTIYELKVGRVKGYNAVIGGSHESLNFILKNGNTAGLLAFFTKSLEKFRSVGPPSLKSKEIDWFHEDFAQEMNKSEVETELNIVNTEDEEGLVHDDNLEDDIAFQSSQNINVYTCQDYGNTFNINVDPEEKIFRLMKL